MQNGPLSPASPGLPLLSFAVRPPQQHNSDKPLSIGRNRPCVLYHTQTRSRIAINNPETELETEQPFHPMNNLDVAAPPESPSLFINGMAPSERGTSESQHSFSAADRTPREQQCRNAMQHAFCMAWHGVAWMMCARGWGRPAAADADRGWTSQGGGGCQDTTRQVGGGGF